MLEPERDLRQTREFLRLVLKPYMGGKNAFVLHGLRDGGKQNAARAFEQSSAGIIHAMKWAEWANRDGFDVYFRAGEVGADWLKNDNPKAVMNADILSAPAVWIDSDTPAQLAKVQGEHLRASLIVTTGTRPDLRQQRWWLLQTPATEMAEWEAAAKGASRWFESDRSVAHANRMMRLPGLISYIKPHKKGRVDELVTFEVGERKRFELEELRAAWPFELAQPKPGPAPTADAPKRERAAVGDPDEFKRAVLALDPDLSEPEWLQVLAAIYAALPSEDALALASEWSQRGSKWDAEIFAAKWRRLETGEFEPGHAEYVFKLANQTVGPAGYGSTRGKRSAPPGCGEDGAEVTPLPEMFSGAVFVHSTKRFILPNGGETDREGFNLEFTPAMHIVHAEREGKGQVPSATALFSREICRTAFTTDLDVKRPFLDLFEEHGRSVVNVFDKNELGDAIEGDPAPFIDHINRVAPEDVDLILDWLAWVVQNPGDKPLFALALQGAEGNGKDTLVAPLLWYFGRYGCALDSIQVKNQFNGWLEQALFVNVQEFHGRGDAAAWDRFKPYITNDRVQIESKGADQRTAKARAAFFMTSNHRDAFPKTESDRRLAVVYCEQQSADDLARSGMDGGYFKTLHRWLADGGNAIAIDFLKRREISYDMKGRAPTTSSHAEVVAESMSAARRAITEFLDEECTVNGDLRENSRDLFAAYRQFCIEANEKTMSRTRFGRELTAMGFGRSKIQGVIYRTGLKLNAAGGKRFSVVD